MFDAVNSTVRLARLRLLAAAVMRYLQQKKPHLAAERLVEITLLPQSRQGDRPAFLTALRFLVCLAVGDAPGCDEARLEVERALGDPIAAEVLIVGCAAAAKQHSKLSPRSPKGFTAQERSRFPVSMAKAIALARDIGIIGKFQLPAEYVNETHAQFPRGGGSLTIDQIRLLGELGIAAKHLRLAWAASAAGLDRTGPEEAYFLLLRARALPDGDDDRYEALTAAAAELARFHRDLELVDRAVEAGRNPFDDDALSLTVEQARDVLAKEKASPAFPSRNNPGPDYSYLFSDDLCMCPSCCAERGEFSDADDLEEMEEDEMERAFYQAAPKGVPREILPALYEVAKQAFLTGQNPDEVLSRILGSPGGKKKKKGRG